MELEPLFVRRDLKRHTNERKSRRTWRNACSRSQEGDNENEKEERKQSVDSDQADASGHDVSLKPVNKIKPRHLVFRNWCQGTEDSRHRASGKRWSRPSRRCGPRREISIGSFPPSRTSPIGGIPARPSSEILPGGPKPPPADAAPARVYQRGHVLRGHMAMRSLGHILTFLLGCSPPSPPTPYELFLPRRCPVVAQCTFSRSRSPSRRETRSIQANSRRNQASTRDCAARNPESRRRRVPDDRCNYRPSFVGFDMEDRRPHLPYSPLLVLRRVSHSATGFMLF